MPHAARLLACWPALLLSFLLPAGEGEWRPDSPFAASCRYLATDGLTVAVMDPEADKPLVQGVRYCPLALVTQAAAGGAEFFYNPETMDPKEIAPGLASEFDAFTSPPGFDEAPLGGVFLKIGVGALVKRLNRWGNPDYAFYDDYDVARAPATTVAWDRARARFTQTLEETEGFAYRLAADLRVEDGAITVDWRLENTGRRAFETVHYVHNSFRLGPDPVGPGYALELPYAVDVIANPGTREDALALPNLDIAERGLRLTGPIPEYHNLHLDRLAGTGDGAGFLTVSYGGRRIRFRTEPEPEARMALHMRDDFLCPEQFVRFALEPGADFAWRRHYEFSAGDGTP